MRGRMLLLLIAPTFGLFGVLPVSAQVPAPMGASCTQATPTSLITCTAKVPSFDGVPLDADLTLPPGAITPRPLIVMMHGYGSDKTEWESATSSNSSPVKNDYNTASFASRGYAVLTYTARGFSGSCGQGPLTPGTGPFCASGWTHLADRRFEVRDTQFLAGLLADAGVADPQKIAVTGDSYGGGQSLLLAMQGDTVATIPSSASPANPGAYEQATNVPWISPVKHLPMHLAAAVPLYPWSDLIESLMPNGRASDGVILADGNRITPVGIEKQSYVSYLFFSGNVPRGYYCPEPCADQSANLTTWFARISAGEPYPSTDPILLQALAELQTWKSAFYQDSLINRSTDQVPIFDVQGWTDNLFPEVEGVSLVNKLRLHGWPVKVAVADAGHPLAQNKLAVWNTLHTQANSFLDQYLKNGSSVSLDSSAQVTTCDATTGTTYTGGNWASLAPYRITLSSTTQKATAFALDSNAAGTLTDPILVAAAHGANGACVTLPASTNFPSAVWDFPVTTAFTLLGEPVLHLDATVGGVDAEINSRLWDVAPNGTETLVTRGAFRFNGTPGAASIDTAMQGNGWDFAVGHTLRLEVTQNDAPYLRMDNLPSAITYAGMSLTLPTPTAPTTSTATTSTTSTGPNASTSSVTLLAQTGAASSAQDAAPLGLVLFAAGLMGWRRRSPIKRARQGRQEN